jgi:hypothetical protein
MPLQKLQFRPGVNREGTTLSNEGGYFDGDKIRFRSGFPEKIGGWQRDGGVAALTEPVTTLVATSGLTTAAVPPSGAFWGVAKAMWNWINLTGYNLLAVGTNLKYYIQNSSGGAYNDVTPIRLTNAGVANAFTTTNLSTTVTVNDPGHGAQAGDFVNITSVSGAVNGITAAQLTGEFQIQTVTSNNTYTITAGGAATSTGTSAATATFNYQLTTGNTTFTYGTGWGVGGWGGSSGPAAASTISGGTAVTASSTTPITLVSITGYNNGAASMTTSTISATGVLTVGTLASGTIYVGMVVTGSGVDPGTYILSNVSGTGTGSIWNTNTTTAVASTTITGSGGVVFIGTEAITYTAIAGSTLAGTITRGVGLTPTSAHADGEVVSQFSSTATGWGLSAPAGLGVGIQLRLWSQSNYGEDLVFNPRGSPMYYWANNGNPNIYDRGQIIEAGTPVTVKNLFSGGTTTFTPDATCPSVANFVLVSDASRFTFAFGCNDPTGVYATTAQDPMQVRWSDQNTLVTWTPAITNQAGGIRLSHGSTIITAIQTRQEILVLTDSAIYSFQYLGAPYVWGNQILGDNISIASPNAVSVVNNVTYWMGTDKFYMYSGRVETLPCALRQYIYGNINLQESYQIHSGTNEGYNEIWWFYPSQTGTTSTGENGTGTAGNPNVLIDRYVIFNHLERTWYYGTFNGTTVRPRTAWLDSPLRVEPMAAIGYVSSSAYTNGAVVYHETTVDNNETNTPVAIDAYVQSSDFDIGDGHNFGFVWRLIPDITFDGSSSAAPTAYFTVRPRQNPGSNYGTSNNPSVESAQSYAATTTYNVQQFTQQVFVRIRGRQMAFKISSSDLGTQWQLGVPRIDVRPDGRR